MPARTFLAVDIDQALRDRLARVLELAPDDGAKINWVAAANLHVTMNFLGDVDDETLSEVCRLAARVAAAAEPFEFDVPRIACVPPRGRLRMIWAEVADPDGRLADLHAALSSGLAELGFPPEKRRFKGHITLARIRHARHDEAIRRAVGAIAAADLPTQTATHVTVYTSDLRPGGPIYTAQAHGPLGGLAGHVGEPTDRKN